MVDLQEALTTGEGTVTPEQVEDLLTNFEDLDGTTQNDFLAAITDLIDPTVFTDFEDLFGALGDPVVPTE